MRYIISLFLMMFLLGFSGKTERYQSIKPVVTALQLKEWVSFLASDQMRGRPNGSPEMKSASEWIAKQFIENGLEPVDSIGDYIQNYSYTSRQRAVNERNVIGFIQGTDPSLKNEYIVLSAHFDHIGITKGSLPDSINNGADDNAAGTCTLIGIARTIKERGMKPGRSIVFTAFSGEENGMRGSRYFVSNSPVPVKEIYADLNFEMIGHSEYLGKKKYYMTGCLNSNLDNLIGEYNRNTGFQLIDTIPLANNLFAASDNIAFSRITSADGISTGIPSGTFATSVIAEYLHRPSDEAALFDFENMADLVNHFSGLVIWLSNNKAEIKWTNPKYVRP